MANRVNAAHFAHGLHFVVLERKRCAVGGIGDGEMFVNECFAVRLRTVREANYGPCLHGPYSSW